MRLIRKTLVALPAVAIAIGTITTFTSERNNPVLLEMLPNQLFHYTEKPAPIPEPKDSDDLQYPLDDNEFDYISDPVEYNPFNIDNPNNYNQNIEYDPDNDGYIIREQMGDIDVRPSNFLSFDEYLEYQRLQSIRDYWNNKASENASIYLSKDELLDKLGLPLPKKLESIFGEGGISVRPTGNVYFILGLQKQKSENPNTIALRQRVRPLVDQDVNVGVEASIGDKLSFAVDYNTIATFQQDLQPNVKLEYVGSEDQIIQRLEAGDVSFQGSPKYVKGSPDLFGLKSQLKFGRLTVTSVIANQRSSNKAQVFQNGAISREEDFSGLDYEYNRNFFLSHYFRDNFESAIRFYPNISDKIAVQEVEVWVSNENFNDSQNLRNVVALTDLGEAKLENINNPGIDVSSFSDGLPTNNANDLYKKIRDFNEFDKIDQEFQGLDLVEDIDYYKFRGRKLRSNEFSFDDKLGYISLNTRLDEQDVMGVFVRYTVSDPSLDGQFELGESSLDIGFQYDEDGNNQPGQGQSTQLVDNNQILFTKLIKPSGPNVERPTWDLMMKNVYRIGSVYDIDTTDFRFEILYSNPGGGATRYLPGDVPDEVGNELLIRLMELDNLDLRQNHCPDGIFDWVSGITIKPRQARVIFPVLEPFGDNLVDKLEAAGASETIVDKYAFPELYDNTQEYARNTFPGKNRFILRMRYKGESNNKFRLNAFNLSEGSVTVRAGTRTLTENVDYTVNYSFGEVTIINDAILMSGENVTVNASDNNTFGLFNKAFIGTRLDYWVNDDFSLGATYAGITQRPFTNKVDEGDDPPRNKMVGVDLQYYKTAPGLTRFLDKIPFYDTKEESSIRVEAEGAMFIPGHSKLVEALDEEGAYYIDDFEAAELPVALAFRTTRWAISATPQYDDAAYQSINGGNTFAFATADDDLQYGWQRASFDWVTQNDKQAIQLASGYIPEAEALSLNEYLSSRLVGITSLFPEQDLDVTSGGNTYLQTLDIIYDPKKPGPYNFSTDVDSKGEMINPKENWGGITTDLDETNFYDENIGYIEFWLMDPYAGIDDPSNKNTGEIRFHLGTISEDILRDGKRFYENGLPVTDNDPLAEETNWGKVSSQDQINNAFTNNNEDRDKQDVGYDGLTDAEEIEKFKPYRDAMLDFLLPTSELYQEIFVDPSKDNFSAHGRDDIETNSWPHLIDKINNTDGNSPITDVNENNREIIRLMPDAEDINDDYSLKKDDKYFEYVIKFDDKDLANHKYVSQTRTERVLFQGVEEIDVNWYNVRIPIDEYFYKHGEISEDFTNIQFFRVLATDFDDEIKFKLADLQLTRRTWRELGDVVLEPGIEIPDDEDLIDLDFDIISRSLTRSSETGLGDIPYAMPPGLDRVLLNTATNNTIQQDENSIGVRICDLPDGVGKAIFKADYRDVRNYDRIRMFVHARELKDENGENIELEDRKLEAFIRLGDDFDDNYYEYNVALNVTRNDGEINPLSMSQDELSKWIWPEINEVDFDLKEIVKIKKERNYGSDTIISCKKPTRRFIEGKEGHSIVVKGNPDLGKVKVIMLGVKNPKDNVNEGFGEDQCGEVWFNELRLVGPNEELAYAATVNVDMTLADLGTINIGGEMETNNFGNNESQIADRRMDNYYRGNISGDFQLDKIISSESALTLPMYFNVSEELIVPEYDPFDSDVKLDAKHQSLEENDRLEELADSKSNSKTRIAKRDIVFSNIRYKRKKDKDDKENKKGLLAPENFNISYSFSKTNESSPYLEKFEEKRHNGGLGYNWSRTSKYIEPLKKVIDSKKKYLVIFKDINFNPLPNKLSFNNEIERRVIQTQLRGICSVCNCNEASHIEATYSKDLSWLRDYGMNWKLTKSIDLNYSATNLSRIDEECGAPDKDEILSQLKTLGRNLDFTQSMSAAYTLPTKKIPILDWTTFRTTYKSDLDWEAGPLPFEDLQGNEIDSLNKANTIGNSSSIQFNAELDLKKLYRKIPALKRLDQAKRPVRKEKTPKVVEGEGTDDTANKEKAKKQSKGKNQVSNFSRIVLKPLVSIKKIKVKSSLNRSTVLPGFIPENQYLGQNFDSSAPGFDFILGYHPDNRWFDEAAKKGWITDNPSLDRQIIQNDGRSMEITAKLEPWNDWKVDLKVNWEKSELHRQNFEADENGVFSHYNEAREGSFEFSTITLHTLFDKVDDNLISESYRELEDNFRFMSQKLGSLNDFSNGEFSPANDTIQIEGYAAGYGPGSSDVALPAFYATYTGQDANKTKLNLFKQMPLPNWLIQYSGLHKLPMFEGLFKQAKISHSYNSRFATNKFFSDYRFAGLLNSGEEENNFGSNINDQTGNFISYYRFYDVTITENLNPLIGVDITWNNGVTTNFAWNKSKTIGLSFEDKMLNDARTQEFVFGVAYKFESLGLPLKLGGKEIMLDNTANLRFDTRIFEDKLTQYQLIEESATAINNQLTMQIDASFDYQVTKRLNTELFFNWDTFVPRVQNNFKRTNWRGGFKFTMSLSQ